MLFQSGSFSRRIAGYFGALFLAAMAALFYLWYFGVAAWGLVGAGNQSLNEATTLLEIKANLQQTLIDYSIRERRGDIQIIAERSGLSQLLKGKGPALQSELERQFEGLHGAYPDRYQRLLIVDPTSRRIMASNSREEVGRAFDATWLIERATQPGAVEIVEPVYSTPGVAVLAITRQLHLRDSRGDPTGPLEGILVGYADFQKFVGAHAAQDSPGSGAVRERSLLLDTSGEVLARFPARGTDDDLFQMNAQAVAGFEGALAHTSSNGQKWLVVYRHIALSGSQGWRLVHYASEADALGSLQTRVGTLAIAGLLLTLLALLGITLAARRVARPLKQLAQAAKDLGAGDLSARAPNRSNDSREVAILSQSFNAMAHNIQQAQQLLERRVQERTAELQQSEDLFRNTFRMMPAALTLQNTDGVFVDCSDDFCKFTGLTREEVVGRNAHDLNLWADPAQRTNLRATLQRDGLVDGLEFLLNRRGGSTIALQMSARYMTIAHKPLLLTFAHDISQRKLAEQEVHAAGLALQESLREKTALLLEIHHRVKNNLQVITSLLRLEGYRSKDAATKSVLQDMQSRVRSMATLHETIYRKGTFASIDLGSYLGQIAAESLKSLQTGPGAVHLRLNMGVLPVGLDQATPAGMLMGELISNCLKHGFADGQSGDICVTLQPLDAPSHWRLRVSDTGAGLSTDFDNRRQNSLGLQLVGDLATQMGGALHIGAGPEAVFTVDFKAEVPASIVITIGGDRP